jgi:chemotaxis protein histidine kinase CheA
MTRVPPLTEEQLRLADERVQLLLRGRAYQMFYEELNRSFGVPLADEPARQIMGSLPLGAEALKEMRRKVHSVKGSSGFFGFSEIQDTAGQLETVLATLEPSAIKMLDSARDLMIELQRLTEKLPRPAPKQ